MPAAGQVAADSETPEEGPSGALREAVGVWLGGVKDALMLHECIFFLAQSETIRFRTLQCFMLNGVIFLGSILLFNFAIEPALGILRRLVQEEEVWATEFIATSFSFLYKILWIYPIYCISFVLNTVMYQEIADSALAFAQCTPTKATPHLERLIQETWRVLVNLVYLLEMYLAAKVFAIRRFAEGQTTTLPSAMALRLVLGAKPGAGRLLAKLSDSFAALCSQAPLKPSDEEVLPFLTQLQLAVEALPAQRGVQFLGLGLSTPSGTLREALTGEVDGLAALHPGSLLLWRGCTSVTSDPMLAKEAALEGGSVALVFKVRSSSSRDVAAYSPSPDLRERLLPPRRCFRVQGIFALEDMILRRGTSSSGNSGELLEAFEVPNVGSLGSFGALAWEEACTRKAACVVLDEDEQPQVTSLAAKV